MGGAKGFRNLPKLERLKRGRPLPPRPPAPRGGGRPLPPPGPARAPVLTLTVLPPTRRQALEALAEAVGETGGGGEAYLVGGAVRDALLGRPAGEDLDLAVPSGALGLARRLAARLGGAFVTLDEARGAARVVVRDRTGERQVDVTDFRAPTLEADLRLRDFTVNALAAPLIPLLRAGEAPVVDPTGGLADLARGRLRLAGPRALDDDPLRALRGVRLAAELGFALEGETRRAARRVASRLPSVAAERVREELARLLALPRAASGLRELDRLGLLEALLPEIAPMKATAQPRPHRFPVWEHSVRTVEAAERLLARLADLAPHGEMLAAHLAEPLGGGLTRAHVLKLAALLHDVAKPGTRQDVEGRIRFIGHDVEGARVARAIAERLRLSGRATEALVRLVRHHLRPMHLAQVSEVTRRARYRFFRDLGAEARDLLLLALADAAAVGGQSPLAVWRAPAGRLVADLLRGAEEERARAVAPPLLRGGDVMAAFRLGPGPEVGRLLALAREAQDLGVVTTREEALAHLERALRDPRPGLDTGSDAD